MAISRNLTLRILTSVIILPLLIWLLTLGPWVALGLSVCVGVIAMIEWFRLIIKAPSLPQSVSFLLIGNAYIFLGCFIFWFLYLKLGWQVLLFTISTAIVTDISAYFVGSTMGGPKLAPHISPNKTWSGATGGILGAILLGWLIHSQAPEIFQALPALPWPFLMIGYSIISQLGDLLESWAKRKLNAKDSSHLIPGHGGILDRLDSILPVIYFTGLLSLLKTL